MIESSSWHQAYVHAQYKKRRAKNRAWKEGRVVGSVPSVSSLGGGFSKGNVYDTVAAVLGFIPKLHPEPPGHQQWCNRNKANVLVHPQNVQFVDSQHGITQRAARHVSLPAINANEISNDGYVQVLSEVYAMVRWKFEKDGRADDAGVPVLNCDQLTVERHF